MKSVQIGEQLARLDDATIDTLISRFEPDDAPMFLAELRHIGAATRAAANSAYDRRATERRRQEAPRFKAAVEKTGRRQLVTSAITTHICLVFPAVSAVEHGFEV